MEALFVLLGLAILAVPVAVIVLIVMVSGQRRDLRALRERVATLETGQTLHPTRPATQAAVSADMRVADATPSASLDTARSASTGPTTHGPAPSSPVPAAPGSDALLPDLSQEAALAARTGAGTAALDDQTPEGSATPWDRPKAQGREAGGSDAAGSGTSGPDAITAKPTAPAKPGPIATLFNWVRDNWFYVVAAVSLALAGIFLVEYGVETGLLTPPARVAAALLFGVALIVAGETIRRRSGDGPHSASAHVPSTLSGAGLVSMMGAVLAARLLYDLIGPTPALAALFVIAVFGLGLGWRHGPLLAAVGVTGGMAAPFLVGGTSAFPEGLLAYFALLTALGLGIDTLRRWGWISVLSLVLGLGAGALLMLSTPTESMAAGVALYAAGLVVLSVLIPARSLVPDHAGPSLLEAAVVVEALRPGFPVLLAFGALIAACLAALSAATHGATAWGISLGLMTLLGALGILAARRAPGLQEFAALPALTILALLGAPEVIGPVLSDLQATRIVQETQTEVRLPWTVTWALIPAVLLSLVAAWRSLGEPLLSPKPAGAQQAEDPPEPFRAVIWAGPSLAALWAGAAVVMAPAAGLVLELVWQPVRFIGAWPWALHALAMGTAMVVLAGIFARRDGTNRLRAALATVSALACLSFALSVILTEAALTLALAAVVISAAALDRRFDLPPLGGFVMAGVVALGYRLLANPGLGWAMEAPIPEVLAAHFGNLGALMAALWLLAARDRPRSRVVLESACWSVAAITLSVILYRGVEALTGHAPGDAHWVLGLQATVWIAAALAQVERQRLGGVLRWVRIGLAGLFGLLALGLLGAAVTVANPLTGGQVVHGPAVVNTLALAYGLPAMCLMLGGWRLRRRWVAEPQTGGKTTGPRWLFALIAGSLALFALWTGLMIRHFWQGGAAMGVEDGIRQPELYTYTVALLLLGAGLFYHALSKRSQGIRRTGVLVIALAVAKVFLIDISGLDGLARVFSFLLLGLSLAGLAWINRWVELRAGDSGAEKEGRGV